MQVIFVRSRHRLPRISAKIRAVIARLPAVFSLHKVEVICIFAIRICQRLFEPFMLVGTVVPHQIHHNVHASLFCLGKQLVKLLHRSEFLRDRVVVGNVIPLIHKGRFINRREPDDVNAKLFQIVQLRDNSPQIPDSVPVRIQKALRINLICHFIVPPFFLHCTFSFFPIRFFFSFLYDTVIIIREIRNILHYIFIFIAQYCYLISGERT